jgi:hypothetical protein
LRRKSETEKQDAVRQALDVAKIALRGERSVLGDGEKADVATLRHGARIADLRAVGADKDHDHVRRINGAGPRAHDRGQRPRRRCQVETLDLALQLLAHVGDEVGAQLGIDASEAGEVHCHEDCEQ